MKENPNENSSDTLKIKRGWEVSKEGQVFYKEESREKMIEFINNFGSEKKRLLEQIFERATEFAIELSEDPNTWPRDWRGVAAACVYAANVEFKGGRPMSWALNGFGVGYSAMKPSLKSIREKNLT